MQDTAGSWLMTVLTTSPLLISLMQTAASLPVVLLGLPAGATADIFDRRRLLIGWQAWMLGSVAVLSLLTFAGVISPWVLLALTFALNVGSAMNNPAWQAIVPELVPRSQLADAVTLNSAAFNLARAVGPALGGLAVAVFGKNVYAGAATVFLLNALSFVAVIWVLYRWERTPLFKSALPAERMFGSIRSGLRYVRHAPNLQKSLARAALFTVFVSAVWSLLPVVARRDLHQGALGYGILNGSMGIGAVLGAFSLAELRRRFTADVLLAASSAIFSVTMLVLALVPWPPAVILVLVAGGFSWTATMSTLNVSVQLSVPSWVQARALGVYQMTFQAGMALGAVLWGIVAERFSSSTALLCSGCGLLLTLPLAMRLTVLRGGIPDVTPYKSNRPAPQFAIEPHPEDGPVRVSIEYRIDPDDYKAFTRTIHQLKDVRMRGGAIRWAIFQDVRDPGRMLETFLTESWIDYLRHRERFTTADFEVRDRVWSFHRGEGPPKVTHMIYAREVAD